MTAADPPKKKPVPPYRNELKSPLQYEGDIEQQIETRLVAICKLYGIDRASSDWERELLAHLLTRHVEGFRFYAPKSTKNDDAFFVETVDALREQIEEETGKTPSIDAVIQEIVDARKDDNPFHGRSHSRLMRVYSGRKELLEKTTITSLGPMLRYQEAMKKADASSFARLIRQAILKRYA